MKQKLTIRFKATFLLLVFAMHSIIGFACAIGVDFTVGKHHEEVTEAKHVHVHANGKKHEHKALDSKHHHHKETKEKDDCCTDKVVKLQNADKNISVKADLNTPVLFAIINTFFSGSLVSISRSFPPRNIIPFFYPPPPDIIIEIQRIQI